MFKFIKKTLASEQDGSKRNVMRYSREMSDEGRPRLESDAFVQENYVPPDPEEMSEYSSDEESLDVPENREELRSLVVKFYAVHDPSKDANGLDSIVDIGMKYGVSALNESLVKKYGEGLPFDDLGEDIPASIRLPTKDENDKVRTDLLHKLEAFYTVHDPSKFDNTEAFYSLVEWGMRYGIPLLNEKLVKKYGEGMQGVAVPKRSTVKRNTENWRKSGLPQPYLPTYEDESESEYDEDDDAYDTYQGDDHTYDDETGGDAARGNPLKFATKLFPSGVMSEFEVAKHESRVPHRTEPVGTDPCNNFQMDLEAREFGTCTCGHSKDRHLPTAFGSFGTQDMETVHTSLKAQWDKIKKPGSFHDPRETRKYEDKKIAAVWAKESGSEKSESSKPKHSESSKPKQSDKPRDKEHHRERRAETGGRDKPRDRTRSKAKQQQRKTSKPPVKPVPPTFLQSSPESRPVNNFAPNPKIGGPRIPQPKKLAQDDSDTGSHDSDGPCDHYVLDLTGAAYGNCKCGFSRADHDKAKYRPKVAMSLRMKWDESPYRNATAQTTMGAIKESSEAASSKPSRENGSGARGRGASRSAMPEEKKKGGILRSGSGSKLVAPDVPNPKYKDKKPEKSTTGTDRRAHGSTSSSRRHGSQSQSNVHRKPSKAGAPLRGLPEKGGSSSELRKFLKDLNLESFASKLKSDLGVESVSDLEYVVEHDLQKIGMKPIQRRKLLKASGAES